MSSLIPSRQIAFSTELAATLGLEEAILLQCLSDESQVSQPETSGGYSWFSLGAVQLKKQLPFWQESDIQRIAENLRQQGVILISSAPLSESKELRYAFNEGASNKAHNVIEHKKPAEKNISNETRANLISPTWKPDEWCIKALGQHGVPIHFIEQQVPEFVLYWRERGITAHSWSSKFNKHVMRNWRTYESRKNDQETSLFDKPSWEWEEKESSYVITDEWHPSESTIEFLIVKSRIKGDFIEGAIPEFILYWMEKGIESDNWDAMFRKHVQRQWDMLHHNIKNDNTPTTIAANWVPSQDCYRVLELAKIDLNFAQSQIPEFIMYWKERNELRPSWDKLFVYHAKKAWKTRHKDSFRSTKDRSLMEDLTDTSWGE